MNKTRHPAIGSEKYRPVINAGLLKSSVLAGRIGKGTPG
jgi:hypothetical protein